jgi:hypothetical protein
MTEFRPGCLTDLVLSVELEWSYEGMLLEVHVSLGPLVSDWGPFDGRGGFFGSYWDAFPGAWVDDVWDVSAVPP